MISPERRTADINRTIGYNPTLIVLSGKRRYQENGKQKVETLPQRELVVRIFPVSRREGTLSSEHQGIMKQSAAYGMLAKADAGLEDSSVIWEEFESAHGKMRIADIFPQIVRGVLCGFQVLLERIT